VAAAADGGERTHAHLVHLARSEDLRLEVLVLGSQRLRVLAERLRRQLVRGHVCEVARPIRPLGHERGLLGGLSQVVGREVAEHDALDRVRSRLGALRLPPARRVPADDRPFDERPGLLGEGERETLVEEPADAPSDPGQRLRRSGRGSPQRIGVDLAPLAEACGDEARGVELAVQVQ
jgi:hypothetical protein